MRGRGRAVTGEALGLALAGRKCACSGAVSGRRCGSASDAVSHRKSWPQARRSAVSEAPSRAISLGWRGQTTIGAPRAVTGERHALRLERCALGDNRRRIPRIPLASLRRRYWTYPLFGIPFRIAHGRWAQPARPLPCDVDGHALQRLARQGTPSSSSGRGHPVHGPVASGR